MTDNAPTLHIDPEAQKALDKAMKVLNMARRKQGNEKEAEAAAAKFQELLTKYNLSEAQIEQASGKVSGKREEKKQKGGVYLYQRDLWMWAAELNFCLYWTTGEWQERQVRYRSWDGTMKTAPRGKWVTMHKLVGRTHNVAATIALATYLEEAIDRVTMEVLHNDNNMRFSNYAVSMRKGMAQRLTEKMAARRREQMREEERIRRDAEAAAVRASRAGVSTSTAVSLESFAKSERDANLDHLYGEGFSAKRAAEKAQRAAERRAAEEEYARWAAANPEEARKKAEEAEAELRKKEAKAARSSSAGPKDNTNYSAYYRGYDAAEAIGLDTQVATPSAGRLK